MCSLKKNDRKGLPVQRLYMQRLRDGVMLSVICNVICLYENWPVAGEHFEGRRLSYWAASGALLYILIASGGYFNSCCLSDLLPVPSS